MRLGELFGPTLFIPDVESAKAPPAAFITGHSCEAATGPGLLQVRHRNGKATSHLSCDPNKREFHAYGTSE